MTNIFSKYKFIFYLLNSILIFLYVFPGSVLGWIMYNDLAVQPKISPDFGVSSNHVMAFFILSFVGFFTFKKSRFNLKLIAYLIIISILLEITHNFIPGRGFRYSDLLGNLLGVFISSIINFFFKKNEYLNN